MLCACIQQCVAHEIQILCDLGELSPNSSKIRCAQPGDYVQLSPDSPHLRLSVQYIKQ